MAEKKKTSRPQNKIVRASDHRSHYVIGMIPQWTEDDLRLHMYNEVLEGAGGPYYISTTQVIIPRSAVQRLIDTLKRVQKDDGEVYMSEVSTMPLDVALAVDMEAYDKGTKTGQTKKKVKIRRR